MKKCFILGLVLILFLVGCSTVNAGVTFESEVANIQFHVRGWNAEDLVQITFQDGHVLFLERWEAFQFQIGLSYSVTVTPRGSIRTVEKIIRQNE